MLRQFTPSPVNVNTDIWGRWTRLFHLRSDPCCLGIKQPLQPAAGHKAVCAPDCAVHITAILCWRWSKSGPHAKTRTTGTCLPFLAEVSMLTGSDTCVTCLRDKQTQDHYGCPARTSYLCRKTLYCIAESLGQAWPEKHNMDLSPVSRSCILNTLLTFSSKEIYKTLLTHQTSTTPSSTDDSHFSMGGKRGEN